MADGHFFCCLLPALAAQIGIELVLHVVGHLTGNGAAGGVEHPRKELVDEGYIDNLFDEVSSLYRLDQIGQNRGAKAELGPLPSEAKALICVLVLVWLGIAAYVIFEAVKKKKKK